MDCEDELESNFQRTISQHPYGVQPLGNQWLIDDVRYKLIIHLLILYDILKTQC